MTLTRDYIMRHRTDRKAWTRSQLEAIGVEWPPTTGWVDRAVGREITREQQRIFEAKERAQ